jgi:diadenosine tetraphosphatase ApaH/serine/threonine PP2A family protein phosphatase
MALYLIGDVQGCDDALGRLLAAAFSPSRDRLIVLGDLVNRGPASLAVLRRLVALGAAGQSLLGNHDLHLLALASGARAAPADTVGDVLAAPDRAALLDWLRQRPLAQREQGVLLVHAGVLPQWTAEQTLALAGEVQAVLRGADWMVFLQQMYGNQPDRWHDELQGAERLRVIVNALTRLRFCTPRAAWSSPPRRAGGGGASRLPALVRRAGAPYGGRVDRLRPLVHAGRHRAARADCAGHRLRVGRMPERRAAGRRWPRGRAHPGALRAGAGAGPGMKHAALALPMTAWLRELFLYSCSRSAYGP